MKKPTVLVFASGTADGGGSGARRLVEVSRSGELDADIIGFVSNRPEGGVKKHADELHVPFTHFPEPWDAESYQRIAKNSGADIFMLSGWLKLVRGLDLSTRFNSRTVINIHPGPLPAFGGKGMHGHHVHEAVMAAYHRGEVTHSAVTMHFVTEKYDEGPVILNLRVPIMKDDTPETLAARVNKYEHKYQPKVLSMVANGLIRWDGASRDSLQVPDGYLIDQLAA